MSLSELMSSMDLAVYPQIALVIFLVVFAAVTWRIFTRRGREECRRMATLPLDDAPVHTPPFPSSLTPAPICPARPIPAPR